ncbi:Uncharacterized conserved protein, circularly permuted ATPgrasp superfamily [Sphingomonas laterariae]|uniref:Uncharacterized conserved protein, circularly permuted ATPgrasp superfamily n=1 Tax=Edaphosphingomonas laterariae TaxID=861865 RepID=A0A239G4E8_9SPHN|nr:circularly permuted type 2 ATP-grasp protein [Sphingomonas laterariae]SNS64047.1 Uncharacterized conserved protein, circularly permuted ATPgrasp superfamily [Sphingomonas laterariae]
MSQLPGLPTWGEGWLASYLPRATSGDILRGDVGRGARWWNHLLEGMAGLGEGNLNHLQDRITRQVAEIGTSFRLPGEAHERPWRISAIPLLIGEDEWRGIERAIGQRAELLERVLADIFGEQALFRDGALPAVMATGSEHFWRTMIGVPPPGGHRLHTYVADIGRGPDGEWRVLADYSRAPAGAGYALENRLAASRVMGTLYTRLNIRRLAPFFSAFREGMAAACKRSDPRIGLLTPGRFNQSYAEQAHLARYLGFLLVEGEDLAVREDQLFVRTIEGLKRIDALWRRLDTRFIDPLTFDAQSAIGVPGLMDAVSAGNAVVANAPGAGVIEATALSAFLPGLARRLTGEQLHMPNIATWWCGQEREREQVEAMLDELLIAPAFGGPLPGLPDGRPVLGADLSPAARAELAEGLRRRPQDYVGQEVVHLSTAPTLVDNMLVPCPFTMRVFACRDADGQWTIMPGGFARFGAQGDVRAAVMGEGAFSADVCVVAHRPVDAVTLVPPKVAIRRNPGTLPSRAADNLFWLGRYLERGEATLRLVRAALGGTIEADAGAGLLPRTMTRLRGLLISSGAATDWAGGGGDLGEQDMLALALSAVDGNGLASVRRLLANVHAIGEGTRDRLSADVWRLIDEPMPEGRAEDAAGLLNRATALQVRFSALAGLAAENMGRTAAWRFHDVGRRIERAVLACRLLRNFADDDASADDLTTLLDLTDSQISYRARYMTELSLAPVRDLVALDAYNPRSLAYQVASIGKHLAALPVLRDDGMAEEQQLIAIELGGLVALAKAEALGGHAVMAIENRLLALSDAIGRRYFLQGGEALRAASMILA